MKQINSKLLSFFMVTIFSMMSMNALAGTKTFYFQATATSSLAEGGTVYVSFSNAEPADDAYASTMTTDVFSKSQWQLIGTPGNTSTTLYLYAKANEGYSFVGWFDNAEMSGQPVSTDLVYKPSVTSTSASNSSPAPFNYYAKFIAEGSHPLECTIERIYMNVGDEPKANDGVTYEGFVPKYSSSNTAVATVAADGKVTPVSAGSAFITVAENASNKVPYVVTVLDYSKAGITQIGNGDFEDWSTVTDDNHAPKNWNSFETAEGNYASAAGGVQVQMVQQNRPGSNGLFCAEIYSRNVLVANAQGNLTLGCINAGSLQANNKDNHNYSNVADESKSETISKIPTALKCWVKFVPDNGNQDYEARVAATVHDKFNYITYGSASHDNNDNKEHVVASAEQNFKGCDWTELTIPFTLSGNAVLNDQLYIVVNFSTNKTPGGGSANDHLFIDDVELVYDTEYDKVPVTVSDAKYATFVAPFDVKMPAAITASTVETVGNEVATRLDLVAVEDNLVAANTPVILNADEVQNRIAYGVADPVAAPTKGLLVGTYEAITAPVGSYVLQNNDDKVGFYKVVNKKPTVGANRCYLTVREDGSADAPAFFFGGEETTAIEALDALTTGVAEIYTLDGMKVGKLQRGINIVKLANGKTQKVMVK